MAVVMFVGKQYVPEGARVEVPGPAVLAGMANGDSFKDYVFAVQYEGAVLATWEHNGYDDSDFYAAVWTGEKVANVQYATTRFWTYNNSAKVDATDEVREAAAAWLNAQIATARTAAWNAKEAMPAKDKVVEVVKGRKVPIGTMGTVFWVGADKYNRDRWGTKYRVGFKTEAGDTHFVAMQNVRVVNPVVHTEAEWTPIAPDAMNFMAWDKNLAALAMATVTHETMAENGYKANHRY